MPRKPRKPVPPPEGSVWIDEAALRIGVAVRTLYSWRYANRGPQSYEIGRKLAYEIKVLDAYLAERRNPQPQEPSDESRPPEPRRLGAARKPLAKSAA